MSRPDGAGDPAADDGARADDYSARMQALEAGHAALAQASQNLGEHLAEHARLLNLADRIGQLSQMDWPALQRRDPAQAQQLMTQLFQMRQAYEIAAAALHHKQQVRDFEQRQAHARRVQEGHAVLARDVPGWSPALAARLTQYALSQGMQPQELQGLSDPRLVKILRHAALGAEAEQGAPAGEGPAQALAMRPAVEVGGGGGAPQDPNRMSTDDWMRHRRGQLHAKAR